MLSVAISENTGSRTRGTHRGRLVYFLVSSQLERLLGSLCSLGFLPLARICVCALCVCFSRCTVHGFTVCQGTFGSWQKVGGHL